MSALKIFNVNWERWYTALSMEQLKTYFEQEYGPDPYEENEIIELTEGELDTLIFYDNDDNIEDMKDRQNPTGRTFREQLKIVEERGEMIPCMFATSEY